MMHSADSIPGEDVIRSSLICTSSAEFLLYEGHSKSNSKYIFLKILLLFYNFSVSTVDRYSLQEQNATFQRSPHLLQLPYSTSEQGTLCPHGKTQDQCFEILFNGCHNGIVVLEFCPTNAAFQFTEQVII
jgi:hypothetical protein